MPDAGDCSGFLHLISDIRSLVSKVGFPIRKSADQSSFAAPRGLSQRSTSFIASQRQGIHQTPLRHLIALIINARIKNQGSGTRGSEKPDAWSALTERPACFEIDPRARAVKQRLDVDRPRLAPRRLFRIDPLFTMSDNARAKRLRPKPKVRSARKDVSCGRASILLVEPDGIEPTTSCLQ